MQENKIIYLPDNFEDVVTCPGKGIIVKVTMAYCRTESHGGIILPNKPIGEDGSYEKKYDIGRVVAVGPDVEGVEKDNILVYQRTTAFRMPDGNPNDDAQYFRIEESTSHIIAILPSIEEPSEEVEGQKV